MWISSSRHVAATEGRAPNDSVDARRSKGYLRLVADTEKTMKSLMIPEHIFNDAINNMNAFIAKIDLMDVPHLRLSNAFTIDMTTLLLPES